MLSEMETATPSVSSVLRTDLLNLRRERDSNPRYGHPYTRFPGVPLQPLEHLSKISFDLAPNIAFSIQLSFIYVEKDAGPRQVGGLVGQILMEDLQRILSCAGDDLTDGHVHALTYFLCHQGYI